MFASTHGFCYKIRASKRCLQHREALTKPTCSEANMANQSICNIDGCDKRAKCRGWCTAHYERWRKHGSPHQGGPLGTAFGEPLRYLDEVVLIYDRDDCLAWPYAKDPNGYGQVRVGGRTHYVTRLVCEKIHGKPPTGRHQAAHSCGRGHEGCCNPKHLRWATVRENHLDKKAHGTFNPPPNRWKTQ